MVNTRFSVVSPLILILSFFASASSSWANSDESTFAIKYVEEGNWVVQVVTLDFEGYPDTLEKRAYATERQADEHIIDLHRTIGTLEKDSIPSKEPIHELRNPLSGEIWTATESWSVEWEDKFADWTRLNFDRNFFKRYKIKTDCADATVALRWIFSRITGLPAGNRLNAGDSLMTNRSVRSKWKNLPTAKNWYEDKRFLAALDYVLVNTYTHSVHADAYPIEINEKWLREGAFHLELRTEDGHTRVFTLISHDGSMWPIEDMWSNVPRKVRSLVVEPFTVYVQPPMRFGGILRHRWVRLNTGSAFLVPAESMPGFSLEQYQPGFFKHGTNDFSVEVADRIRDSLDPLVGLKAILKNLNRDLSDRKKLLEKGYRICSVEDCSPGTANYEDWSSPSRDARIGEYFSQIGNYIDSLHGDDLSRGKKLLENEKKKKLVKLGKTRLFYDDLEKIWKETRFSSDPRDPPLKRWGQSI